MISYSVVIKKKNRKRCKEIQTKSESGFCVSLILLVKSMIVVVMFLGVLYVAQINKLATMGYEIKEKENKIATLYKDNEALKIHAAELKSMHQLELKKDEMNLKKPQEIGYLEVESPVAMRR